MVSFQQTPKPRNYLARREQGRLLLLVMTLGLVMVLMTEARKPWRWQWLTGPSGGGDDPQAASAPAADEPIDTRARSAPPGEAISGTFRSPAPVPDEAEEDAGGRYFRGVKPKYLEWIRDDKPFYPEETKAWFNLLGVLQRTDEPTLRRASTARVTFAQLFKQSKEYRGELVTVGGAVRRAHRLSTPKNEHGIEKFYQVWLFPDDNPSLPMVVYCLHLPKGFPTGMELEEKAEITGFYFKRWAYKAADSLRRAPTLAARTLHWQKAKPAVTKPAPAGLGSLLLAVGVAAALSFAVVVYVYTRSHPPRPQRSDGPPSFDALPDFEIPSGVEPSIENRRSP